MTRALALVAALAGVGGVAGVVELAGSAEAAPLVAEVAPGVTVDWTRGVVTARGLGPADRNAPGPAVARVGARRAALVQARARLLAAVKALPAAGGALGDVAPPERLAREVELAPVVDEILGTDGSVKLAIAVGTEALRQAVTGPRPAPADEAAPEVWTVDAGDRALAPLVGLALARGSERWSGAVRFATAAPAGTTAHRATVTAIAAGGATLELDGPLPPAGAAVVVVVRPEP